MPGAASAATLYVTNNGNGTSCTTSLRCTFATALGIAQPGDVISAASGTLASPSVYQGASNMIAPPANKSGTGSGSIIAGTQTGSPITVRAEVEGGVILDGQFARIPINLPNHNSWWVIEGFNARNGTGAVVALGTTGSGLGQSNNNIIRRGVFWDADIQLNNHIATSHNSSGPNLFEDAAIFGTARKAFTGTQGGNNLHCRRCWIRWEGSTNSVGGVTTTHYNSDFYTCENCLISYTGESMPYQYTSQFSGLTKTNFVLDSPAGYQMQDGGSPVGCKHVNWFGSIVYVRPTDRVFQSADSPLLSTHYRLIDCVTVRDSIYMIHPSSAGFSYYRPIHSSGAVNAATVNFTNVTTLGGVANSFGSSQTRTNLVASTSTSLTGDIPTLFTGTSNPWTGTTGAQICFRTENTTLTSTPLWPWPMNERIRVATGYAGAYSGPCVNCKNQNGTDWTLGTRPSRTETNVTTQMEALFGTIPSQCRVTVDPTPFPIASGFPVNGILDTFSGSGTLTGWTTVSGNGFQRTVGAAVPISGFSVVRYNTNYAADQEAYCKLETLPTADSGVGFFVQSRLTDINNRVRAAVFNVSAANGDTVQIDQQVGGAAVADSGSIALGYDIAAGDSFGVRATGTSIDMVYQRASEPGIWRVVTSITGVSATGFIGLGAASGGCNEFGGGNLSTAIPLLTTTPASLSFTATAGGSNPASQSFQVTDAAATGSMQFTVADDAAWLSATPSSGTGDTQGTATINISGLAAGTYNSAIVVTAPDSTIVTSSIPVTLVVSPATQPSHGRGGRVR